MQGARPLKTEEDIQAEAARLRGSGGRFSEGAVNAWIDRARRFQSGEDPNAFNGRMDPTSRGMMDASVAAKGPLGEQRDTQALGGLNTDLDDMAGLPMDMPEGNLSTSDPLPQSAAASPNSGLPQAPAGPTGFPSGDIKPLPSGITSDLQTATPPMSAQPPEANLSQTPTAATSTASKSPAGLPGAQRGAVTGPVNKPVSPKSVYTRTNASGRTVSDADNPGYSTSPLTENPRRGDNMRTAPRYVDLPLQSYPGGPAGIPSSDRTLALEQQSGQANLPAGKSMAYALPGKTPLGVGPTKKPQMPALNTAAPSIKKQTPNLQAAGKSLIQPPKPLGT
jgi:hypothetical protein